MNTELDTGEVETLPTPPPAPLTLNPPPPLELNPPTFDLPNAPRSVHDELARNPLPKPADAPTVWRCWNCTDARSVPGRMFEGPSPVCPLCGVDGRVARFSRFVSPIELIHYDPPHPTIKRMHANVLACNPAIGLPGPGRASGDIIAVTCPKCLLSDVGRKALERRGTREVLPSADFQISEPKKEG